LDQNLIVVHPDYRFLLDRIVYPDFDSQNPEILPIVPQLLEKILAIVVSQAGFWLFKILESVTAENGK